MEELHQHKKALGTNGKQRGSKHRKAAQYTHRLNRHALGVPRRFNRCAEPAAVKSEHRLVRRMGLNSVGSTGVTHRMIRQNQTPTPV